VFFMVVLQDRLVIRIESERGSGDPHEAARKHLGDVNVEIETTKRNQLLDVEQLSRSPSVYKPVLVSDWRQPGRRILSVNQGMIEWTRPTPPELWRWLVRSLRSSARGRRLARGLRVAKNSSR
jgi:hypothetical protein